MGTAFAGLAGAFAWVGWFAVAPALGLPSLGPAAMFNRVLAPRADSGYWLGWAFVVVALAVAILVYLLAVRAGLWRANMVSGLVYGTTCWLISGALVMPLLGVTDPFPVPPPPAAPDAMHGTFMMLHLGVGALLAALVPWLLLGAILGATAGWRPDYSRRAWLAAFALAAAIATVVVIARTLPNVPPTAARGNGTRTLSSGPVAALPEGSAFISVFQLPQAAGATLGPHAHVPGFACSLRGVETMTFADGPTLRVAAGQAGFMGPQQVHAHVNGDDVVPAATIAILIVVTGVIVTLAATRQPHVRSGLILAGLVALVVLGGLAVWNPWSNDWLFISIRPEAARGGPMPLPSASRLYESTDLAAMPPGPYVETVQEVTIAPGSSFDFEPHGASLLLVIDGQAQVQPSDNGSSILLVHQAVLLQPGVSAEVTATSDRAARLLEFTVAPAG